MDIEKALKIPGWMTKGELEWLADKASKSNCIIEIGSWRGRTTRVLADNTPGVVFSVDGWTDFAVGKPDPAWTDSEDPEKYKQPGWLWEEFSRNLSDQLWKKVIPVRANSNFAAKIFANFVKAPIDMIFIDAGHVNSEVENDILSWRPLLRLGGLLCGHDFGHPECPDVAPTVCRLLPAIQVYETIWCELK